MKFMMMKLLALILVFNFALFSVPYAQCILPTGGYSWGGTELVNHISSNCGGNLSTGLIAPTDATITIQNNDIWDLTAYGAIVFTIQGNASIGFNGSDELILSAGSSLVIENTSSTTALSESGVGTNIRITIGTTTYTGNEFDAIIAAGGVNQDGLLPVELLSFSSRINEQLEVELNWVTLIENNNSHFDIEYSIDGFNFEKIGTVLGLGSSINYRNYDFIHSSPSQGANYYRLKQVDNNGNFEYLKTIVQELRSSDFFELKYHTLSSISFEIKFPAKFSIFDLSGKKVVSLSLEVGPHIYNLSELEHGQYIIRIYRNGQEKIIRIVQ